jgi:polysaccharide deacetylase family protein (PEP-CTERM system associated)
MLNAMTVDVEDYFQVSAFEPYINRADWESIPTRVEKNTHRILDMFSEKDAKATFFTLGWIAEKHPQLVKRIISEGHELASHGWSHVRVINQSPEEFREDVIKTKHYLEDISGQKIKGYRAASYSIGATNLWALDILEETGHIYSSSIYPIRHDLYGMPEAPRFPFYPNDSEGLLEIPITTFELADRRYPCGGGGFFRLLPYVISKSALKRVNKNDKQSCVFYFHPWEIDPDQPKLKGINAKTRFRHYLNLNRMEKRLECLLGDFQWDRMDKVFI